MQGFIVQLIDRMANLNPQFYLLVALLLCSIFVLDRINLFTRQKRREAGIDPGATTVSIDGSRTLPLRHYVSERQGLAGRPDALVYEEGFIIPVERKPLANKIRDRYIAQLLVYMRLIEEFEGKRPPYGYLILGKSCRKVKIENSPEKQAWLQKMIDDMQAILAGVPAKADPHPIKCRKCDLRESCQFRVDDN